MNVRKVLWGWLVVGMALAAVLLPDAATLSTLAQEGIEQPVIRVDGVWARPADAMMSAAFMQIANHGTEADRLVAVWTEATRMTEIHETTMEGDMMRMRPLEGGLEIPAGETVILAPRGLHIMLMGLTAPLVEGEFLPLSLEFESGTVIEVEAAITHTPIPEVLEPDALTEAALAAVAAETYVGQVVDPPIRVQDFELPSSMEGISRLSDTGGTWRVIFFGYMHCPDFCPLTLVDYKQTRELLGEAAEDVTFMYISVDAARDTPDALRRYLATFDPTFVGFAGDDATLSRIQPDYGFYYERRMASGSQAVYTIDHSTRSYLLDRDGVLRASFAYHTSPRALADALQWYLAHE